MSAEPPLHDHPDGPTLTVCYVVPAYPVLSETFVYREIAALRARGVDVLVAALRSSPHTVADLRPDVVLYDQLAAAPLELLARPVSALRAAARVALLAAIPAEPTSARHRARLPAQFLAAAALARFARTRRVRHFHAHFAHAPATLALLAAELTGLPFSFTGHANDLFANRAHLTAKLRRAAFVAAISEEHRRLYRSIHPGVHCPLVRCGVSLPPPARPARTPGALLTVARLVVKKGIDTLIAALPLCPPDVTLTVVGDGPELPALCSLAARLGVSPRIAFAGPLPNDRVQQLLLEAALFVLPCRTAPGGDRDGIPVVLMEAMAAGLPVLCGDLPAIRELVLPGQTGELVPPDNPSALAQRICDVLSDTLRRDRLAAAARHHVAAQFSLDANAARLHSEFLHAARRLPPLERRSLATASCQTQPSQSPLAPPPPLPTPATYSSPPAATKHATAAEPSIR